MSDDKEKEKLSGEGWSDIKDKKRGCVFSRQKAPRQSRRLTLTFIHFFPHVDARIACFWYEEE